MSATVRESYAGYVTTRLLAYRDHAGEGARVWDYGRLLHAGKGFQGDDADAFRGPWRNVRPYVTTEFREWIEEYNAERLTYSQWHRVQADARRVEAQRERDYFESVEFFTDELQRWAELTRDRDALIVAARERGASFKDLMATTGLSRMALHNVIAADARAVRIQETTTERVEVAA